MGAGFMFKTKSPEEEATRQRGENRLITAGDIQIIVAATLTQINDRELFEPRSLRILLAKEKKLCFNPPPSPATALGEGFEAIIQLEINVC